MFWEVLAVRKLVQGAEHPETLTIANNLAASRSRQGKDAEAERIYREVLAAHKRLLGPEHPDTLTSAANLAVTVLNQRKYAEAQLLLEATLEVQRRVLGPAHPETLYFASLLDQMRSHMHAAETAPAAGNTACGTVRPLPAGTRVLVQRLVAKPEHNGKHARVVSFDARSGRYCVSLDDGRKLSLKAECVHNRDHLNLVLRSTVEKDL